MENNKSNEKQQKPLVLTTEQIKRAIGERENCILDPDEKCILCGDCLFCDLDPTKLCLNCGKCLDNFNTDEKGFVKVKIDKIIRESDDKISLDDLLKQYGLDDED